MEAAKEVSKFEDLPEHARTYLRELYNGNFPSSTTPAKEELANYITISADYLMRQKILFNVGEYAKKKARNHGDVWLSSLLAFYHLWCLFFPFRFFKILYFENIGRTQPKAFSPPEKKAKVESLGPRGQPFSPTSTPTKSATPSLFFIRSQNIKKLWNKNKVASIYKKTPLEPIHPDAEKIQKYMKLQGINANSISNFNLLDKMKLAKSLRPDLTWIEFKKEFEIHDDESFYSIAGLLIE